MDQKALEQKQKYLRENVLEKGYDPDKFMEFLIMKKGNEGINLDIWSFEELIEATKEFLKNNKIEIESNLNLEEKEDIGDDEEKDNKNELKPEYINKKNIFQDSSFGCLLIERTPITKMKEIEIEATKPKIEKGGIFSFSYSTYLIVTSTLNLQVRRKYSDFIWLYNTLKRLFVNCIIPPFFKKKEKLDNNKMIKKIYFIEKFLNGIAVHPILRNSKIFYDFLSIMDEKEFIKSKNEYGKIQSPSSIKQIKTMNGEIKISFNEESEKNYEIIKSKINYQEVIYDKLLYHYKLLLIDINQTNMQMKEISNIWKELYNQENVMLESKINVGIYQSYSKIMDKWENFQKNNCTLIYNSIQKFFRFIKEEYNSFKDLSLIVENQKSAYNKKNKKLLIEKENFFSKIAKDENKIKEQLNSYNNKKDNYEEIEFSKFMSKDIIKVNELKRDYGCYLNIYLNEYERLRDFNENRFKNNLLGFIKDLSSQLSNYTFNLGEILSFIDTVV